MMMRTCLRLNHVAFGTGDWFIDAGTTFLLFLFAGLMSGLTLGLMSLNLIDLEILRRSGSPDERKQAAAILPVVKKQHQLLALPLCLDEMFSPTVAVLLSVTFVLIFGEVLDLVLGHGEEMFRRAQLKALVSIHGLEAGNEGEQILDETTIISEALDLTEKTAKEAMTSIESTFSLDADSMLDREAIEEICKCGHKRIPVYSGNPKNLVGLLLVKCLLTVQAETVNLVSKDCIFEMPRVPADMPLYDVLYALQKASHHLAAVVQIKGKTQTQPTADREKLGEARLTDGCVAIDVDKSPKSLTNGISNSSNDNEEEVIGIITLEDVFKGLMQEEIIADVYVDVHKRIHLAAAQSSQKLIQNQAGASTRFSDSPREPEEDDASTRFSGSPSEPFLGNTR